MMKDYYQVLEIESSATEYEIKKAYRRLVMLHHPDHNKSEDANQILSELNEAYSILGDSDKKMRYDMQFNFVLTDWLSQEPAVYSNPFETTIFEEEEEEVVRVPRDWSKRVWHERLDFRDPIAQKYAKYVSKLYFAFLLLLLIDFTLPYLNKIVEIEEMRVGIEGSNYGSYEVSYFRFNNRTFSTPANENSKAIHVGNHAIYQVTPILRTPRYLLVYHHELFEMWAYGTFYDNYLVIVGVLAFLCFIGLAADSPDLHLYAMVMSFMTFFLLMIMWIF